MKKVTRWFAIALLIFSMMGCGMKNKDNTIVKIEYMIESGPILTALQANEQYVVSRDGVAWSKEGRTDGKQVAEGAGEFEVEMEKIDALFDQLQHFKCSTAERVEPQDEPDGGFSESFVFHYNSGDICYLYYTPGVRYQYAEQAVQSIREFVYSLRW